MTTKRKKIRMVLLFVVGAVTALALAASHDSGWTMAVLWMMMLAVLALLIATVKWWGHLPMDSAVRKRREGRTILDILGNEKEL